MVVIGAGTGGSAAAVQAARMGAKVALVESTAWVGGQMTAAGVSTMDESSWHTTHGGGLYRELMDEVDAHYDGLTPPKSFDRVGFFGVAKGFEARIGRQYLEQMVRDAGAHVYLQTTLTEVHSTWETSSARVIGVELRTPDSQVVKLRSRVLIDATEYGDVLPLVAGVDYRVGNHVTKDGILDPEASTSCIQGITHTAVIKNYGIGDIPSELELRSPPTGYDNPPPTCWGRQSSGTWASCFKHRMHAGGQDWRAIDPFGADSAIAYPTDWLTHVAYRSVPNSSPLDSPDYLWRRYEDITRTGVNWHNDVDATVAFLVDPSERRRLTCLAKTRTLQFLYYAQRDVAAQGSNGWSVADDEGYADSFDPSSGCEEIPDAIEQHLPVIPYVRESRRLVGVGTLSARDINAQRAAVGSSIWDSVAVSNYPMDLHGCGSSQDFEQDLESKSDHLHSAAPFQIPLGVFVPKNTTGFLAAEKNFSQSRLASGATRLQHSTMNTGQAVGALAAIAALEQRDARNVRATEVQWALVRGKSPPRIGLRPLYTDLRWSSEPSARWAAAELLATHQVMAGYADGRFGSGDSLTRGQLAALLDRLLELSAPPEAPPFFEDCLPESCSFYLSIQALATAIPADALTCSSTKLLFCPNATITRAQLTSFVLRALGLEVPETCPDSLQFQDVRDHPDCASIEAASLAGLLDEPELNCAASEAFPSFCPDRKSTRADAAFILAAAVRYLR